MSYFLAQSVGKNFNVREEVHLFDKFNLTNLQKILHQKNLRKMFRKLLCDTSSKENVRKSAQTVGNAKEINGNQQRRTISENVSAQGINKNAGKNL